MKDWVPAAQSKDRFRGDPREFGRRIPDRARGVGIATPADAPIWKGLKELCAPALAVVTATIAAVEIAEMISRFT